MTAPALPPTVSLGRRIARFPLLCILLAGAVTGLFGAVAMFVIHVPMPKGEGAPWLAVPLEGSVALGSVVGQLLAGWLLEKEKPSALGWAPPALGPLGLGLAIGVAIQSLTVGILALAGWYTLPAGGVSSSRLDLLGALVLFLGAAVFEEVLMRGILYRQLERLLGSWLALALTAAFFGFGHKNNPGATPLSEVAIALEAGILLAAAYAWTRALWLPIGIHWAWNFFEGPVFGEAVSGTTGAHWLSPKIGGPVHWTGGVFGPEAGLVAVIPCTLLGIAFVVLAVRSGRMFTPPWMRKLLGLRAS